MRVRLRKKLVFVLRINGSLIQVMVGAIVRAMVFPKRRIVVVMVGGW